MIRSRNLSYLSHTNLSSLSQMWRNCSVRSEKQSREDMVKHLQNRSLIIV